MTKLSITILFTIYSIYSTPPVYNTPHFALYYSRLDTKNIKAIADTLESNYARIVADLQSPDPPHIKIYFYPDPASLRGGIKPWVPHPASWTTGITLGDSAIHILSPNFPGQDVKSTVHEFAHCVSRCVNWTIVNNPRWLWEAVAIYESNQTSDPRKLPYLQQQKPPTLSQLNDWDDTSIYDVGYLITQYLVETHGYSTLHALIKNNGNIGQTLHMDDEAFTRAWFAFVKNKYVTSPRKSSFLYLINDEGPRSRTGVNRELCANHKLSRNCK